MSLAYKGIGMHPMKQLEKILTLTTVEDMREAMQLWARAYVKEYEAVIRLSPMDAALIPVVQTVPARLFSGIFKSLAPAVEMGDRPLVQMPLSGYREHFARIVVIADLTGMKRD